MAMAASCGSASICETRPRRGWTVLDWDDVDSHHPVKRVPDPNTDLAVGWGTGQPQQRRTVDHSETEDSVPYRVQ